ncbi:T9SS type A sorting domain-containing protein [Oceanihabitans sp. 2_MG-2023]|uniref:T9SS type A sorting domain-containing protein n=1 Tax=Oceanihabitans sp. 2_MG-2023 TaxID=3062661 RepID=UPI0026E3B826|nr:T9SS type A sorting domain-containing protein [Oceanihabitans sp. 2_MG-2023]MDO6597735.1 T9SS type A sorting domain-containing protein [Oceanihabitans sp. 2_MG-2023]
MKTKLLFILTLLLSSFIVNAQDIGFLGDFNGWGDDVNMTTTDNITFTLNNYYLPATGLKFRQDDDWANNWGGDTFPAGTWSSNNIPVVAGFYDISINIATTEYSFTAVTPTDQNVSVIGDFNAWAGDFVLSTTDNITYTATDVTLTAGELKFRRNAGWSLNYGGTSLTGTATPNSTNITIPSNTDYDISFNIETLAYSITESSLSIEEFDFNNSYKVINGHLYGNLNEQVNINIYNVSGQLVKTYNNINVNANASFNLELKANQLYLIRLQSPSGIKTFKTIL